MTIFILGFEAWTRKGRRYHQVSGNFRPSKPLDLGRLKLPALSFVSFVFILSLLLPAAVLIYWSVLGVAEGALDSRFWLFTLNSLGVAGLAAFFAVLLGLPVVYLKLRYPSFLSSSLAKLSSAGYALPGVIIALGIIIIFNRFMPWWYNTFAILPAAYLVRFLPLAMQPQAASLSLVSSDTEEAAKSLGLPGWKVMLKVVLPLILPGVFTGGALVFVSALKELPATLLLRPPGFDTLSVRVWVEASESLYYLAAPPALFIIILSIFPLKWLLGRY